MKNKGIVQMSWVVPFVYLGKKTYLPLLKNKMHKMS